MALLKLNFFSTSLLIQTEVNIIMPQKDVIVNNGEKYYDFIALCSVLFAIASAFIFITLLCLPTNLFLITLLAFGVVACTMSGVNNVITSMAPLYWKDKVNSGKLAGILNGFCYLGSALSSYGLGLVSDVGGWNAVLVLLLSLCVLCIVFAIVYFAIKNKKRSQGSKGI